MIADSPTGGAANISARACRVSDLVDELLDVGRGPAGHVHAQLGADAEGAVVVLADVHDACQSQESSTAHEDKKESAHASRELTDRSGGLIALACTLRLRWDQFPCG